MGITRNEKESEFKQTHFSHAPWRRSVLENEGLSKVDMSTICHNFTIFQTVESVRLLFHSKTWQTSLYSSITTLKNKSLTLQQFTVLYLGEHLAWEIRNKDWSVLYPAAVSIFSGMGFMYWLDWSLGWENRFYGIIVLLLPTPHRYRWQQPSPTNQIPLCYKTGSPNPNTNWTNTYFFLLPAMADL